MWLLVCVLTPLAAALLLSNVATAQTSKWNFCHLFFFSSTFACLHPPRSFPLHFVFLSVKTSMASSIPKPQSGACVAAWSIMHQETVHSAAWIKMFCVVEMPGCRAGAVLLVLKSVHWDLHLLAHRRYCFACSNFRLTGSVLGLAFHWKH